MKRFDWLFWLEVINAFLEVVERLMGILNQ